MDTTITLETLQEMYAVGDYGLPAAEIERIRYLTLANCQHATDAGYSLWDIAKNIYEMREVLLISAMQRMHFAVLLTQVTDARTPPPTDAAHE